MAGAGDDCGLQQQQPRLHAFDEKGYGGKLLWWVDHTHYLLPSFPLRRESRPSDSAAAQSKLDSRIPGNETLSGWALL